MRVVEGVVESRSPWLVRSVESFDVVVQLADSESFGWLSNTLARVLAGEMGRRERGVRLAVLRRHLKRYPWFHVKVVDAAMKFIAADPQYAGLAAMHREMIERVRAPHGGKIIVGNLSEEWKISRDIAAQLIHNLEAQDKMGDD